jgi:hypothetical protein
VDFSINTEDLQFSFSFSAASTLRVEVLIVNNVIINIDIIKIDVDIFKILLFIKTP